jgi:two-component system CheB/CheR fusion protein
VILSGTGSDGSIGIRMIKARGGLTVAQEPAEAEFDGMPRNAVATGLVDLVLPVAQIPAQILRVVQTQPSVKVVSELAEETQRDRKLLQAIFAQVRARTGQDFSRYKPATVLRRIGRRMLLNHTEDLSRYLVAQALREHPQMARAVLIAVTGYGQESDRERAYAAGFDHHLPKPARVKDLLAVLARRRQNGARDTAD